MPISIEGNCSATVALENCCDVLMQSGLLANIDDFVLCYPILAGHLLVPFALLSLKVRELLLELSNLVKFVLSMLA